MTIGLQLYTIRGEAEKNFLGALEKVAQMGYKAVEFAGFGGHKASEIKNLLNKLNLEAIGSHTKLDLLRDDLETQIRFHQDIGAHFIICPFANMPNRAAVLELAALMNRAGKICAKAGIKLCYHNHSHEFQNIGGEYAMDLFLRETDPEFVLFEPDVCFIAMAGIDPVVYLEKYGERCSLIHLKEYLPGFKAGVAELGTGDIDFLRVINTSRTVCKAEALIVEQQYFVSSCLDSSKQNLDYLQGII